MTKVEELLKLAESKCRNGDELHILRTYYGVDAIKSQLASLGKESTMIKDYFQAPYFKLLHFTLYTALMFVVYQREFVSSGNWKKADKEASEVAKAFDKEVVQLWPELFEEDNKKGKK